MSPVILIIGLSFLLCLVFGILALINLTEGNIFRAVIYSIIALFLINYQPLILTILMGTEWNGEMISNQVNDLYKNARSTVDE